MGHGNHWETIFPSAKEALELLPEIVHNGGVVPPLVPRRVTKLAVGEYALVQHPCDQPLSCLAAIRVEAESNQLVTFYPAINEGEETALTITDIKACDPEDSDFEGVVTAINARGVEVSFFEPRFPIDKGSLSGDMIFQLAAIAYSIEAPETEIVISSGPLVELERQRLTEEGKDSSNVHSVTVYAGELRCYIPHSNADFEFQSVVEEVNSFTLLGKKILQLKILLGPKDDTPLAIALFVSEKVAGGMVPKVGDAIRGIAWLQGIAVGKASAKLAPP